MSTELGDRAAAALVSTLGLKPFPWENGWAQERNGVAAVVTGIPAAPLNNVVTVTLDATLSTAREYLDTIAGSGLPHCLQLRPGVDPGFVELAESRGMVHDSQVPLMVLTDPAALGPALTMQEALTVRTLAVGERHLHAEIAAPAFEAPVELFKRLVTESLVSLPGVRVYAAELAGKPVATAMGATVGEAVTIYNVGTDPDHRRRGYGAAVTAQAVLDGLADGAEIAVLQSSEAGFNVYEQLGFELTEDWECWLSEAG